MDSVFDKMTDSEYLTELGLWWKYESPVFVYDEMERPRLWTPDFFIPKFGLYFEVCGSEDFDYQYREKIYNKNELCVIFVHCYKKEKAWKKYLVKRLEEINTDRQNIISKMDKSIL